MEDMIFGVVAMLPVAAGIFVGKKHGTKLGVAAGVGLFVVLVLVLTVAGYGD